MIVKSKHVSYLMMIKNILKSFVKIQKSNIFVFLLFTILELIFTNKTYMFMKN